MNPMTTAPTVRGTVAIPEARSAMAATGHDALDAVVAGLQSKKDAWVAVSVPERVALLRRMIDDTVAVADRWVAAACQAKGLTPGTSQAGEEALAGPLITVRNLRLLAESLENVAAGKTPRIAGPVVTRPDGQVVARVFPDGFYDKLFYGGISAEIWMEPGVTAQNLSSTQAVAYKKKTTTGKVALVLGAGNVSSIGPLDAVYKLFVEDQVVVLKMNPVNAYLGPFFEEAMRALVDAGYLHVVYGGAAEGEYLVNHQGVDEIHITGSDKTHDAIVFGGGPEGARRKMEKKPLITKRITSELGNVSPVIVVPGPWDNGDLAFQGANLASMLTNNAGFNCNATRMIIHHAQWSQREELLDSVRKVLAQVAQRKPYYPGAEDRWELFVKDHPQAEKFGERAPGKLPWTFIPGIDPKAEGDVCLTTEAFCGVFGETTLEAAGTVEFIRKAVEFCNNTMWGTLNCSIIVHPKSLKEPGVAEAVEQAIADLRYGTVAVNHWAALAYALGSTTWGAFPGHDLYDIQSGIGVVHNTLLFDKPQKTVVRGPFRIVPTPVWFATNKKTWQIAPKLLRFEAHPSFGKVPGILWEAIRG